MRICSRIKKCPSGSDPPVFRPFRSYLFFICGIAAEKLLDLLEEKSESVSAYLDALAYSDIAREVSRLDRDNQVQLLETLEPQEAAEVLETVLHSEAADLLEQLTPEKAAPIIHELPSDEKADIVSELENEEAEAILQQLPHKEAQEVRTLIDYEAHEAGGLMITELLSYRKNVTAGHIIEDLRTHVERYRDYQAQYIYITHGIKLCGVLRLRDLLLALPQEPISRLMIDNPHRVNHHASLLELKNIFEQHAYLAIPVVDKQQVLLGVVTRANVEKALEEKTFDDYRKSQGLVEEELRTMPIWTRSRRRLGWLSINIVLNLIAASIIALYEDVLASAVALAVFLPIISDMSGCSGNQAVAVSMRELALGLVRPSEVFRVWSKEISVGLINGIVLGLLIGSVAWLWKGNPYWGFVIGGALTINTVVAVSIGGTVPLILKKFRMDPALASGPILTTITDMCGFFIALSFASIFLAYLV